MNAAETSRAQAVALAAVLESAILVDQLARTGTAPPAEMRALTGGLFCFEWERAEDVFGGTAGLGRGLDRLDALLSDVSGGGQGKLLRYAMSLLYLGKRLARDGERLAIIRSRLQQIAPGPEDVAAGDDELAASLAAVYQDTISTYRFRIQVAGAAEHLQEARVAARIRAVLLAGVRAAVLWRHAGGSRLDLLFARGRLSAACRALRRGD